jgi:hypothetical protein
MSVAAFTNTRLGGYIVVGADDQGSTIHGEPSIVDAQFDEANLSQIVGSYLSGRISLTARTHTHQERLLAVIYVAPSPDELPVIFLEDGQKQVGNPKAGVKFRRGQVYVRKGTRCVPAQHADWTEILARHDDTVRTHARGPMNDILHRMFAAASDIETIGTADLPVAVDFEQDLDIFAEAVEAVRPSQHEQLRRLIGRRARSVSWDANVPWDMEDVSHVVDRLLVIGAHAVREGSDELVDAVLDALVKLYVMPINERAGDYGGAMAWRAIAAGAAAIGGLAVREEAWSVVRKLALPPKISPVRVEGGSFRYASWMRHAVTMAARANLLGTSSDGRPMPGGLVRFARETAGRIPSLTMDVRNAPVVESPDFNPTDQDRVLDSICRFDYVWNLLALLAAPAMDIHQTLPGFAVFYVQRTAPVVMQLSNDGEVRRALAPGVEDVRWREAVRVLDGIADSRSVETSWRGWSVIGFPDIDTFLRA